MQASQLRAARALLGMKQSDLAEQSGVSLPTVKRLEGMDGSLRVRLDTITAIRVALESAGVEFTNGDAPGVRLSFWDH